MSTFEQSRGLFNQTHFTVFEIDLPSVEGECTLGGEAGYGTPITCEQPSNATTTYKFTDLNAPLLPESGILRIIKSISETPTKLNSGKGLSSRATGSVMMIDITGKDPNPDAPAVTDNVKNSGGFLAKMIARNELTNRVARIKNYRVESDNSIDLENGAQTRHFIIESVVVSKKGEFNFKLKDELSVLNLDESVWPIPLEGYIRTDVDEATTTIPVDPDVTYLVNDTVRSGDEFMKVTGVSGIGTGSASLSVNARGSTISYTKPLSKTIAEEHSSGDEIFVCEVVDDSRIDDLLERILLDVGVPADIIPKTEWAAEVDEWHPLTRVNTLYFESEDTFKVIAKILTDYMLDMWFNPVSRTIELTAISAWKESTSNLVEGNQIDFETISNKREENLRATRALISYDKRFLLDDDEIGSFKKITVYARTELEGDNFFGKPKAKKLMPSSLLDEDGADILVNRWVNRYSNPFSFKWKTQERKLNFNTGDVVDIEDLTTSNFDGTPVSRRAQITSIKPNYTTYGRDYSVTALSYEPLFNAGSEIIIGGRYSDINIYTQFAGAPSQAVELIIIFDAAIVGGSSNVSIRAGAFPAGSKLIFILANGADLQARGGQGGAGEKFVPPSPSQNGLAGGVVYDAGGVDTDIYFSGATPSINYPIADGSIKAPSGGAGGIDGLVVAGDIDEGDEFTGGDGGNGGDGRNGGAGGAGEAFTGLNDSRLTPGKDGGSGNDFGTTTGWGKAGVNNNATGGDAGSGVIDSGATVAFFGDTPQRYINGNGDH